jgi:hypothetical protein
MNVFSDIVTFFFRDFSSVHKLFYNTLVLAAVFMMLNILTFILPAQLGNIVTILMPFFNQLWKYFFIFQAIVCVAVYILIFIQVNNRDR